jgi:hypothetical protein
VGVCGCGGGGGRGPGDLVTSCDASNYQNCMSIGAEHHTTNALYSRALKFGSLLSYGG